MAYERKLSIGPTQILFLVFIAWPVMCANIDCEGKAFYCVNSTHFMICVDFGGGVSSTLDSFVIPCPVLTECRRTNRYECEFPKHETLKNIDTSVPVVNELPPEIISDTSASSLTEYSSYTTDFSSVSSVTGLPEVTLNINTGKLDLHQEPNDIITRITTESIQNSTDINITNKTKLIQNSLDYSDTSTKTIQISAVSNETNQKFQDSIDINASTTNNYQISSHINAASNTGIIDSTNKLITTDIFQMTAKTEADNRILPDNKTEHSNVYIDTIFVKLNVSQETTTDSPLSANTTYFQTTTETDVLNKTQFNFPSKNKNEILETPMYNNLLNESDISQGSTGISLQSTTVTSNVSYKGNFYQFPTKNIEKYMYPNVIINISNHTTESYQTPTPTDTITTNSDIFQGPAKISHLAIEKSVNSQNNTLNYQTGTDNNSSIKMDILEIPTGTSSLNKSESLHEPATSNVSTKEYLKITTDSTHMYQPAITYSKIEQTEAAFDDTPSTIRDIYTPIDVNVFSTEKLFTDRIDVSTYAKAPILRNLSTNYITTSTSYYEMQYFDKENTVTTTESTITQNESSTVINFDDKVDNTMKNFTKTSNFNTENQSQNYDQNTIADVFTTDTSNFYNKEDKPFINMTNDARTVNDIIKHNLSNINQDITTTSSIITNAYTDTTNTKAVIAVEGINVTPAKENSDDQQISTESSFFSETIPNIKRNVLSSTKLDVSEISRNDNDDFSTARLKLFATSPLLLEELSNTVNSSYTEELHKAKPSIPYGAITESIYADSKQAVKLEDTEEIIIKLNNTVRNERLNSTRQWRNFGEAKTVNISNNPKTVFKSISTVTIHPYSYTTEPYKDAITVLNDSVINQTSDTSFFDFNNLTKNSGFETTTANPYIISMTEFSETAATTTYLTSETKTDYYDILNTTQTDPEKKNISLPNISSIPITEPVINGSKLSQPATTINNSFFNNTNNTMRESSNTYIKNTLMTKGKIKYNEKTNIFFTTAASKYLSQDLQQVTETTTGTINDEKTTMDAENGTETSKNINLDVYDFATTPTYKNTETAPMTTLKSFQDSTTVKMKIQDANRADYDIYGTTMDNEPTLLQIDSITSPTEETVKVDNDFVSLQYTTEQYYNKIINGSVSSSTSQSLVGLQNETDLSSSTANILDSTIPLTLQQNTIDKAAFNDTQQEMNIISRKLESLPSASEKSSSFVTSKSIFMNYGNLQTLGTTMEPIGNNGTQIYKQNQAIISDQNRTEVVNIDKTGYLTDRNNAISQGNINSIANRNKTRNKDLGNQASLDNHRNIGQESSLNTTININFEQNNTAKTDQSPNNTIDKKFSKTDTGNIFSSLPDVQYIEVSETVPILHTSEISINFTAFQDVKKNKRVPKNSKKQFSVTSIDKPNVNSFVTPADLKSKIEAQKYNHTNRSNINLNKDIKKVAFDVNLLMNGTNLMTSHNNAKSKSQTITTPTNSSVENNSQQYQAGDSLHLETNNIGMNKVYEQINSTSSIMNIKNRNSQQSRNGNNNTVTEKSSFAKNDTIEKLSPHISQKSNVINYITPQFHCHDRKRGRYSDKEDCSIFYVCIGKHEPIIGKCPINTVFSEISKQCTKNISHCIRENEFKCITAGRFSDILKPNTYYICVRGNKSFVRFKFQCLNGYYLNKTSIKCMAKTELESRYQTSISYENSKSDISFIESTNKATNKSQHLKLTGDKFKCEEEGRFAHEKDCRKYYLCTKNNKSEFRTRKKKCDSDEVFHKDKKECVDADSYEC